MAFMVYTMSMFQWEVPVIAKIVLLGLMLFIAGARVLLIGLRNLKVWIGAALCIVYGGVFLVSDNSNFLFLAACTIGYLGIDYMKIIRTYLIAVGTTLAIIVVSALFGVIENLTYSKDGHTRLAMGTIYPTDYASLVLFLLMYLWVVLKKVPDWGLLILPITSFMIAWKVTYSVTSMICSMLFFGAILYHILDNRVLSKHLPLRNVSDWGMTLVVVGSAVLMVCLLMLYEPTKKWILQLDRMLSYRLRYASAGLRTYSLHPFGTRFEMIGAGGAASTGTWRPEYNFIDCSYLLVLIRYGYLLLLSIVAIWVVGIHIAQRAGDRRLALVMVLIALHSISEHHIIEMNYCITIAMPLVDYGIYKQGDCTEINKSL